MNFIDNRTLLRELLKQGDVMNTVNGGIRNTSFKLKTLPNGIGIEVSNPSFASESFNFTINKDELLIHVMYLNQTRNEEQINMFPAFFRMVKIPYNVEIEKIEAVYENEIFRIFMPFNSSLPGDPFKVQVKNLDK